MFLTKPNGPRPKLPICEYEKSGRFVCVLNKILKYAYRAFAPTLPEPSMQLCEYLIPSAKMNYAGRPPKHEPRLTLSDELLAQIENLAENLITHAGMAAYFKVTRKKWEQFRKKNKRVDEIIARGNATCIASCTSKLMAHVQKGNLKAIMFVLSMRGGWTEKSKVELDAMPEHAPGVPASLGNNVLEASKRYLEIMG